MPGSEKCQAEDLSSHSHHVTVRLETLQSIFPSLEAVNMPKKKKKDDKSHDAEAEAKAQAELELKQRRELAAKAASRTVDGLEHVVASLPRDLIERAR